MVDWAIEFNEVRAGYGETVVLEDIRFALGASETVSVIGRNGVGKTTLLATMMGHTTLHGGRIVLHGRNVSTLPTYRRVIAGLGYVPQEREIFPTLSLRENLEVAARPGPWTTETVFELFPRLAERADHRGNQLSGGEQQMLAIGRALIGKTVEKGLTLVPLRLYFKRGRVKVALALAKGKQAHDKRETIRRRELDREARAAVKERR